mmetsp:Transcript_30792/g.60263  ORF Transcript_30792/g.60263 Transcript_30792/m.60263 type:complete len:112 (+) Transcript_30792:51-386(+)
MPQQFDVFGEPLLAEGKEALISLRFTTSWNRRIYHLYDVGSEDTIHALKERLQDEKKVSIEGCDLVMGDRILPGDETVSACGADENSTLVIRRSLAPTEAKTTTNPSVKVS